MALARDQGLFFRMKKRRKKREKEIFEGSGVLADDHSTDFAPSKSSQWLEEPITVAKLRAAFVKLSTLTPR